MPTSRPENGTGSKSATRPEQDLELSEEGKLQRAREEQKGEHKGQHEGQSEDKHQGSQGGHPGNHVEGDEPDTEAEVNGVDEAYIMAYLGRHVCPQDLPSTDGQEVACGGTMTPVGVRGDVYACNMCNFERKESERVAELERMYQTVTNEAGQ